MPTGCQSSGRFSLAGRAVRSGGVRPDRRPERVTTVIMEGVCELNWVYSRLDRNRTPQDRARLLAGVTPHHVGTVPHKPRGLTEPPDLNWSALAGSVSLRTSVLPATLTLRATPKSGNTLTRKAESLTLQFSLFGFFLRRGLSKLAAVEGWVVFGEVAALLKAVRNTVRHWVDSKGLQNTAWAGCCDSGSQGWRSG